MKIAIGSDHAGLGLKKYIIFYLIDKYGMNIFDFGTYTDESCDYPDYAHQVAKSVSEGENDFGILCCGSGQGVNIVANKHQGIRSVLAWTPEIAELGRQHNDANVLALPARFIDEKVAFECIEKFLSSEFEQRHINRINKIEKTA